MSETAKIWAVRLLNVVAVLLPLLLGMGYIALGLVFRNFWGVADTPAETAEHNVLVIIGVALLAAAFLLPLKSKKRFYLSFGIVTAAMWYGILPEGQIDQFYAFVLYAVLSVALFAAKNRLEKMR